MLPPWALSKPRTHSQNCGDARYDSERQWIPGTNGHASPPLIFITIITFIFNGKAVWRGETYDTVDREDTRTIDFVPDEPETRL